MKIIHNHLTTYESRADALQAWYDLPKEMSKTGKQLANGRKDAEKNIKYQYEHFRDEMARIFWIDSTEYNGVKKYVLVECLID